MAFVKYNVKDNANSTLLVGISAGATSLQVQASAGVGFPSSNFIATIVQYTTLGDETSAVVKREKVLVSNNATDTFTITRGFDGDTPVAFNAGDFIYLHNVSAITEDIQDEVSRIETAKLNIGSLRTGLANAWRLFFSNGSSAETALAFGASGTVMTSNGATSAPTFETPTVSITGLTEDTGGNMNADYLVKNNGTGANTKILVSKYKASDAEALAGTLQNKFIDPKQVKDNYKFILNGTNSLITSSFTLTPGVSTSGSFLLSNHTISRIAGSVYGGFGTAKLQSSPDNSTWSDVYSTTTSFDFSFVLKGGLYYRVRSETTASGSLVNANCTLTYTI